MTMKEIESIQSHVAHIAHVADGIWQITNLNLASFLAYCYPDAFTGVELVKGGHCRFGFSLLPGVSYRELSEHFFSEESAMCSNANALLEACSTVRKALAQARYGDQKR